MIGSEIGGEAGRETAWNHAWNQWRGPDRTAAGILFPAAPTATPTLLWERPLTGDGIAGIVTDGKRLLVTDRDAADTTDIVRCLDASTGDELWRDEVATFGRLDYGNSPRATPLLADDCAIVIGAMGNVRCLDWASGRLLWKTHLVSELGGTLPHWGFSVSPLRVGSCVVLQPGGDAGFVALELATGIVRWRSSGGRTAAYASPILAILGGVEQIVGCDATSLGGWNPATGARLWEIVPKFSGDFNVPTPIALDAHHLFVVSENNGARIYRFSSNDGRPDATPRAQNNALVHDSNTPVTDGEAVYGVSDELFALDATTLEVRWRFADTEPFGMYTCLMLGTNAADKTPILLVARETGEILWLSLTPAGARPLARWTPDTDDALYSHPAFVDGVLFLRTACAIRAIRF